MWIRIVGQVVIRFLSRKFPWFGAMVTWAMTETPLGGAIDYAFGLFTAVIVPVAVAALCVWQGMRVYDARNRTRLLDLHLPRTQADAPQREDDDRDPSVAAGSPPIEEGSPA